MKTDGKTIYYTPEEFNRLEDERINEFIRRHEELHRIFTEAKADAIVEMFNVDGVWKVPTTEEVYKLLMEKGKCHTEP